MSETYSDDEEDFCPLCIEEMDISDRNFKPCPCGYQICQFCYNNIRNEPNGRCPACRRIYDDESVEYNQVSAEDLKRDHARQARREKERKQREKTTQPDTQKKHLAGMRVIQKNLVYVIGLNPNICNEDLHNTLRAEHFFGQYGKIQKIVINKRTNANGNLGLGVYVTFQRKEDAARCINAVDGSLNDGKYLRAAYGTTKYCSSYLRGQTCPNPNCMFLHEPGEDADSYTRRDLSAMQHRNPPQVTPPGLPSLTQNAAVSPQGGVSAAPLPTANAWRRLPAHTPTLGGPSALPAAATGTLPGALPGVLPSAAASQMQAQVAPQHTPAPAKPKSAIEAALSMLSGLASAPATYTFSSPHIDATSHLPQYLAFNLDADERLKQFEATWGFVAEAEAKRKERELQVQQVAELGSGVPAQTLQVGQGIGQGLLGPQVQGVALGQAQAQGNLQGPQVQGSLQGNPAGTQSTPTPTQAQAQAPGTASVAPVAPSATLGAPAPPGLSNSSELLAHLMKGKASSTSVYAQRDPTVGAVLDGLERRASPAELGEYTPPPREPVYVDDGPSFSASQLPHVPLVGDSFPSVWSGIEKLSRTQDELVQVQARVQALNSQQRKLLKGLKE